MLRTIALKRGHHPSPGWMEVLWVPLSVSAPMAKGPVRTYFSRPGLFPQLWDHRSWAGLCVLNVQPSPRKALLPSKGLQCTGVIRGQGMEPARCVGPGPCSRHLSGLCWVIFPGGKKATSSISSCHGIAVSPPHAPSSVANPLIGTPVQGVNSSWRAQGVLQRTSESNCFKKEIRASPAGKRERMFLTEQKVGIWEIPEGLTGTCERLKLSRWGLAKEKLQAGQMGPGALQMRTEREGSEGPSGLPWASPH